MQNQAVLVAQITAAVTAAVTAAMEKKLVSLVAAATHNLQRESSRATKPEAKAKRTIASEEEFRALFEKYAGDTFPKKIPAWSKPLPLSGYSERLKLAFVFYGRDRDVYDEKTMTAAEFAVQQERDQRRRNACYKMGVRLIVARGSCLNKEEYVRTVIAAWREGESPTTEDVTQDMVDAVFNGV